MMSKVTALEEIRTGLVPRPQDRSGSGPKSGAAASVITAAVAYAALGALGLSFAIAPGYASPIFPAAGFAVAILLRSNGRVWPGIWVGSLALNLGVAWLHGDLGVRSGLIAAGIASGSTLQALLARWLVVRNVKDGWRSLEVEGDIVRCLALAGPAACVVSATTGVSVLFGAQVVPSQEYVYAWLNWWSGDTLGVLVMLPISLTLLYRCDAPWAGRLTSLVFPMLLTLSLVAGAFYAVAQWERAEQRLSIQAHGEALAALLTQRFIAHQEALAALRRLIEVTPEMSYRQFEYFTRITLKDNPDIFALSFNPYVPLTGRPAFERSMAKRTGKTDFEIKERDSLKQLVRAADRPHYVVVGYISPLEGNRPALGFDINSESVRRAAIEAAIRTNEPAVTAPVQLVQENRQRVGVLLLHPARFGAATPAGSVGTSGLAGFAVGVIKVDEMVEIATRSAAVAGLVFEVRDTQMGTDNLRIYRSEGSAGATDTYYRWQKEVEIADRRWSLSVRPTREFLGRHHHWVALAVGAGGLALAALLQILLLIASGRTAIVQRKVLEQTAELQAKSDLLEDRNEQLTALFALSPDGFISFDRVNRVKYANPAFTRLTGLNDAMVIGLDEAAFSEQLAGLCIRSARFRGIDALQPSADPEIGSSHRRELIELCGPGNRVLEVGLRRSAAGTVSQIVYFRDVTHETEVDRMKSEFLSTAAHELRTPMASIYGFAEVLLMQECDEETRRELLTTINRQSELMASILNELLDLARIEARRGKDFVLEALALDELVAEALSGYKIPDNREAPVVSPPASAPLVGADRKKMQQAMSNLISNAYKYSPGGGEISIAYRTITDGDQRQVGVEIRDRGIGMTPAQLSRICERFYRADTSGKIPGTGLGMSIVKEIVELHGGRLEFASKVGAGTTVTIWLPAITGLPPHASIPTSAP